MAENERLDLESRNSGRWRQWAKELASGKPVSDLSDSAMLKLSQTCRNLQKLFVANGYPLDVVLDAATGIRGDFREIMRHSRFGREYLELIRLHAYGGADRREVLARVLTAIVEKFADQAENKYGCDNPAMLGRSQEVKERLFDRIGDLAERLDRSPDSLLRRDSRSAVQKERGEIELLSMSLV